MLCMTSVTQSPCTTELIAAWLRGLLAIAWADGGFNAQEQELITALTQDELAPSINLGSLEPITPQELADALAQDPSAAENFLRTAVMVAIADGTYSVAEDKLLRQFCQALGLQEAALEALGSTLYDPKNIQPPAPATFTALPPDVLRPVRKWLDGLDIRDPQVARFLCKMIPSQCPFERDVKLFNHKIVHIPPLCKLNPLYEQLVGLRFRALCYLSDECQEDISPYC